MSNDVHPELCLFVPTWGIGGYCSQNTVARGYYLRGTGEIIFLAVLFDEIIIFFSIYSFYQCLTFYADAHDRLIEIER